MEPKQEKQQYTIHRISKSDAFYSIRSELIGKVVTLENGHWSDGYWVGYIKSVFNFMYNSKLTQIYVFRTQLKKYTPLICKVCDKQVLKLHTCRDCEGEFCEDCQAEYNQFTQIDYNCCKSCAEGR